MEFYLVEEFMGETFTFFHTTIQSRDSTKDATRVVQLNLRDLPILRRFALDYFGNTSLDGVNWSKS
jgi:hypothetical protein